MLLFLISALRSVIEMLGLCLLAQAFLYLLAGQKRSTNFIYQLFALITRLPRRIVAKCLPESTASATVAGICFGCLFALWFGLAIMRKFV